MGGPEFLAWASGERSGKKKRLMMTMERKPDALNGINANIPQQQRGGEIRKNKQNITFWSPPPHPP